MPKRSVPRPRRHERGVTMVELMVALVMISLGVLAVSQLFPAGSRGQLQDRMRTTAGLLAQEKLEHLDGLEWSASDLTPGTHPGSPEAVGPNGTLQRSWLVEAMPAPLTNLKRVTVTVSWTYMGTQSVSVSTYKRR